MRALRLALSLIRVPKLFATLLLWPLFIGLGIAATQVLLSAGFVHLMDEKVEDFQARISEPDTRSDWIRIHIFGRKKPFPALAVCRWQTVDGVEGPIGSECSADPLDVVIRVDDPANFDTTEYEKLFLGSTRRLHLCRDCKTEIVLSSNPAGGKAVSDVYSVRGLGVFLLTESAHENDVNDSFVQAKTIVEHLKNLAGTVWLHPTGFHQPVNISKASTIMILVLNVAFLIIITLWLSLVGHRKVLQYFARNDALLPLVAACGKSDFYSALWFITLLRVSFFLIASLPATYAVYVNAIPEETLHLFTGSSVDFLLWISSIISSLGVMSVIASISELKHRHSLVSFLYKYIPVICFLVGTGCWVYTLFHAGNVSMTMQYVISALPLFGISPMILSPIFHSSPTILAIHTLLACVSIVVIFRLNSRWFAAHLEEI